MVLAAEPLRTMQVTERVSTYEPRTIYRYLAKLTKLGLIDRQEEVGVPSTVTYSLSQPKGQDLLRLLESYAAAAHSGGIGQPGELPFWISVESLGEMWVSGLMAELSQGGRSPIALSRAATGLSVHQIARRTYRLKAEGLLRETPPKGRGKCLQLTDRARRGVALIAGVGRWRQQHVLGDGKSGLSVAEMATVLRTALPLLRLPEHKGKGLQFEILDTSDRRDGRPAESLFAKVDGDGAICCVGDRDLQIDSCATGTVDSWFAVLLDGNPGGMRIGGDAGLRDRCLQQLCEVLWAKSYAQASR
jgi:DNA-binding HxlR family transcriptional regulator